MFRALQLFLRRADLSYSYVQKRLDLSFTAVSIDGFAIIWKILPLVRSIIYMKRHRVLDIFIGQA